MPTFKLHNHHLQTLVISHSQPSRQPPSWNTTTLGALSKSVASQAEVPIICTPPPPPSCLLMASWQHKLSTRDARHARVNTRADWPRATQFTKKNHACTAQACTTPRALPTPRRAATHECAFPHVASVPSCVQHQHQQQQHPQHCNPHHAALRPSHPVHSTSPNLCQVNVPGLVPG